MSFVYFMLVIALGIFIGLMIFTFTIVGLLVVYAKTKKKSKEQKDIALPDNQEI